MRTLADNILYSTINLFCLKNGGLQSTGTGFFWRTALQNDREIVVLVTNKHVIAGCDEVVAVVHQGNDDITEPVGKVIMLKIGLTGGGVTDHPDPDVDLCAIPMGGLLEQAREAGTPAFYKAFGSINLPSEADWAEFDSIEDVVMIGCPRGLYDQHNNLPLSRRGITATPLGNRYGGRDEFMVDMACFPGSSGSPVVMMSRGYLDREKNTFRLDGQRFFLLGILYAGPTITNTGEIVLSQRPSVAVTAAMHLGQVIRSSALLALEDVVAKRTGCADEIIRPAPPLAD